MDEGDATETPPLTKKTLRIPEHWPSREELQVLLTQTRPQTQRRAIRLLTEKRRAKSASCGSRRLRSTRDTPSVERAQQLSAPDGLRCSRPDRYRFCSLGLFSPCAALRANRYRSCGRDSLRSDGDERRDTPWCYYRVYLAMNNSALGGSNQKRP